MRIKDIREINKAMWRKIKDGMEVVDGVIVVLALIAFLYFYFFKPIPDSGDFGAFVGGVVGTLINSGILLCVWRTYYTQQKTECRSQLKKDAAMISEAIVERSKNSHITDIIADLNKKHSGMIISGEASGPGNRTRGMVFNAALFTSASDFWKTSDSQENFNYERNSQLESCGRLFYLMISRFEGEKDEMTNMYMLILQSKFGGTLFILLAAWIEINKKDSVANEKLKLFLDIPPV